MWFDLEYNVLYSKPYDYRKLKYWLCLLKKKISFIQISENH